MFDHRAVEMCFKDPPKVIKQPTVSREILSDPDIELYIGLSIADTYLIHTDMLEENDRNALLRVGKTR
jgi:hypothetical protein